MEVFGFTISRKKEEVQNKQAASFAPPPNDDGSLIVTTSGIQGTAYMNMDSSATREADLVTKYRQLALDPIVDLAIQDIVNEAIVDDGESQKVVEIILDDVPVSPGMKKKIQEEFDEVKRLLEFDKLCYEIFRRWYIDGRIYYHVIISEKNLGKNGTIELRYIDPRHIKKVKEIDKKKDPKTGVTLSTVKEEYYIYNPTGFVKKTGGDIVQSVEAQGVKISKDSIIYCTSGYQSSDDSKNGNMILSYLHKAIRPINQLRSMEDSIIIYRISRAPERRIFYVDVGNLPKAKAEQYLAEIMNKFKNKTVYDASTGDIKDDRKFMTMLEDFWLPRRDGSRGTEITTLPGGQNLGQIEDVVYFQNLVYRSLNVPISRLQPETTFSLGRATEISRDEVKFSKFIARLRAKFATIFTKVLERQLILKKVCNAAEWEEWEPLIRYDYAVDNYFEELKELEMNRDRVNMIRDMTDFIGRYWSDEYIQKNILKLTEEEIKEIEKQIAAEKKQGKHATPPAGQDPGSGMPSGQAQPPAVPAESSASTGEEDDDMIINRQAAMKKESMEYELLESMKSFLEKE